MIICIQCVEQLLTPSIHSIEQRMSDNVNNFCVSEDLPKLYGLSWQIVHQKNFPLALPAGYCIPGHCIEKGQAEKRTFPLKESHGSPKPHSKAYTIKARLTACTEKPYYAPHSAKSFNTSKSLTSSTKTSSSGSETSTTTSSRSPIPPTISTSSTTSNKPTISSIISPSTIATPFPTGKPWQNLPISKPMTDRCLKPSQCLRRSSSSALNKALVAIPMKARGDACVDKDSFPHYLEGKLFQMLMSNNTNGSYSLAESFNECASCINTNMIEPKTFNQQKFQGFVDMAISGFCALPEPRDGAQTKLRKLGEVLTFGTESSILFFNITVVTKPVLQPNRRVLEWQAAADVCGQCVVLDALTIPTTEVCQIEFFDIIKTMINKFCAKPNPNKAFADFKQRGDEFTSYMESSLKFLDFSIVTQPLNLPTMFSWPEQAKRQSAKRGDKDLRAKILATLGPPSVVSRPVERDVATIPPNVQACYTSSACNQARDFYNTCIKSGQAYEVWDCFCRNQGTHVGIGGGLFGP
ncbi:hypothetical protein BJ875DRAFT_521705 [Amylocarpus encephaloides]|uniref:Uncharacterized protein n=1 Tax=Amylocarpus encephaloides TaxID=45428 RepID=A0A9P8C0Y3_9HELO|nr:hypothetical protein BJ875DRAFT_521705 [Amylocarpus encephaloides]